MVDFNVSNGLPGAEELCILAAGRLVRATEGFWLLVAPVDKVLKQCETGYATYVLDGDWKLELRESYRGQFETRRDLIRDKTNAYLCVFLYHPYSKIRCGSHQPSRSFCWCGQWSRLREHVFLYQLWHVACCRPSRSVQFGTARSSRSRTHI